MSGPNERFYVELPVIDRFADVIDPAHYRPIPDDWWVGLTDVQGSTRAIEEGGRKGYKRVNMAGAAAISAVMNAVGHRDFPFVFGGDGTSFAVPAADRDAASDALARTARWVENELDLSLRVAMAPVSEIRGEGHDVLVSRFAASEEVSYAMFSGQGVGWAESEMKSGRFLLEPAPEGASPDLTGLSCRWTPIENTRGCILSLMVAPVGDVANPAFAEVAGKVIARVGTYEREGHPVPEKGPGFNWPPEGLELEARASKGEKKLSAQRRSLRLITMIAWVLDKTRLKLGKFDPVAYRVNTSLNTDYRKFDDVLRMTVDCDPATVADLRVLLDEAEGRGVVRYGLYEQDAAIMTCIVPSIMSHDHMHFLDGAGGGYARAATAFKGKA